MANLTLSDWLAVGGLLIGVASLVYAWVVNRRAVEARKIRQQQLLISLDMARFLVTNHEVVEELWVPTAGTDLCRWLWQSHEKASDLYKILVDQYLAVTPRFTYEDLKRLYDGGLLKSRWQEEQWRRQMAFRPENKSSDAPKYYVPEDATTHPMWYERLKQHRSSNITADHPTTKPSSDHEAEREGH